MEKTKKLQFLNGFRGFLALVVVLNHFVCTFYPALYNANQEQSHMAQMLDVKLASTPFNLLWNGNWAVCTFFLIGGFVLSYKYFTNEQISRTAFAESLIKRYFRLMVPCLGITLIVYVLMKFGIFYNIRASELTKSSWWLGTFWNFDTSFLKALKSGLWDVVFEGDSSYNTAFWTVVWEMKGFLVGLSFIAIFREKRPLFIYLITFVLYWKSYVSCFIVGIFLCDMYCKGKLENKIFSNKVVYIVLMVLAWWVSSYPTGLNVNYFGLTIPNQLPDMYRIYHTLGGMLCIVLIVNSKYLIALFESKLFLYLGEISFSMYAVHMVVIGTLSCWMFLKLQERIRYMYAVITTCVVSLAVTMCFSMLYQKTVEKYSDVLSRHVILNRYGIRK